MPGVALPMMDLSACPLLQLLQPGCLLQSGRQQWAYTGMEGLERSKLSTLVCGFTPSLHPRSIFLGQPVPAHSHWRGWFPAEMARA